MTTPSKVVAVTGSSGRIGTKLLEHLEEMPGLEKLVAIDTRPLRYPVHNISAVRHDVSESISGYLSTHGVTTVVHLAFGRPGGLKQGEEDTSGGLNRRILDRVIESCCESEVEHLIYLSSHCVYGSRPENPLPLTEESALRPAPGFYYAQDNHHAEGKLLELAEARPDMKVCVLRSCPVLGAMPGMELLREFYFPGRIGPSDYNPALQFVDGDDLARILCLTIREEISGLYNVAGDGVVFLNELASALALKRIRLPAALASAVTRLTAGETGAYGHYLDRWPVIMSTAKLRRATGYSFRHTSLEAVAAFSTYCEEAQERLPKLSEIR